LSSIPDWDFEPDWESQNADSASQMNAHRPLTHTLDWVWRGALTVALVCAAWSAARTGVAAWYSRRGSEQDLARAIRWAPNNAENYATLARLNELAGGTGERARALHLRRRATQLEPGDATYWLEQAMSEDEAGQPESAEPDYRRARELFPLSPDVNRALGEYYLRQGRIDDALDALRFAIAADPGMRADVFAELWRAGVDTREVLRRAVPADREALVAYLNALAAVGALDDAKVVWAQLQALGAVPAQDAFQYFDALIRYERTTELEAVWAQVAPAEAVAARANGNLISNGSFELPMLNAGLDWRVIPVPGVFVSIDAITAHDGARSLRIDFEAPGNPGYQHVFEFVPVEANTDYEFSGALLAEAITSDSGPRFELYDAANPQRLNLATGDVRGTTGWTVVRLGFRTGADTHLLIVRVARPPSTSFDNRLSGTVLVDDVRLAKAAN
jgi:tetratricopeptide (TPR) repeat protein